MSLNERLIEVQLFRLRATFHALPLFGLRTQILRKYAGKNYAALEIIPNGRNFSAGVRHINCKRRPQPTYDIYCR